MHRTPHARDCHHPRPTPPASLVAVAGGAATLTLLLLAAPAGATSHGPPGVGNPTVGGRGRLVPVLANGAPREPSTDRAESTDSPEVLDDGAWTWDISVVSGSTDRLPGQRTRSVEWMQAEVRRGLGHGLEVGVSVEPRDETSVEQTTLGQTVQETGYGPTTLRVKQRLSTHAGRAVLAASAFARLPGAPDGPGQHVVEGGVSFPLELPLGGSTRFGATAATAYLADAITGGRHLEGVGSLALTQDLGEHLSARIETVSVWSGENGRPWLGTVNAGVSLEPLAHFSLTLGGSGGLGGGASDAGLFGRVSVYH